MLFAHDTEMSLRAAVALVNSGCDPDTLTTVAQLDAFFVRFDYSGRHDGDAAELAAVRALRPGLRTLLTSPRDTAVPQVNAMLARAGAVPRLVRHDRQDWHVHAVAEQAPWATRIEVETAMAMIEVIRADETNRLGVCAEPACDGLVVDLSRNRSRRFCTVACGNRRAVAAYRARRSG